MATERTDGTLIADGPDAPGVATPTTSPIAPIASGLVLLAVVLSGGYWLTRDRGTDQASGVSVAVPAPDQAPPQPTAVTPLSVGQSPPEPEETLTPPAFERMANGGTSGAQNMTGEVTEPQEATIPAPPKLSSRVRERLKQVRADAKREEVAARPAVRQASQATVEAELVPPGPQGRIVQLGTYATVPEAQANWRVFAARWPYLSTKPRILSPVWVRQDRGWKLIYRLQLGTASQAQSAVICQRVQKAGQPCLVVY